nr:hypothetical protein MW591_pgp150 [Timspurckia oligopyrenoides]UNJ17465.1 hypothetical protein [Timspurckia oligopyrenoides]
MISKIIYSLSSYVIMPKNLVSLLGLVNNAKIGVLYGFFVDSFKLGS